MPSEWEGVDSLIRELGAIRAAAEATRASAAASAAIENAIADAAEAIGVTINAPRNAESLSHARETIATARKLVAALGVEIDRSHRARERALGLGVSLPRRRER
jgi:hypothetical protein